MYQHLRQIGAVRLVVRQVEQQLHGAAHPARVFADQQRACASVLPGSFTYGWKNLAVLEPSEPSMKSFRLPICMASATSS